MKIGIIAPSPVPFVTGGAENLYSTLLEHLNRETSHQAELVKLPSSEGDFWSLMEGYKAFSELDVSRFDLVISTKYPAWMVNHPKHVCYMLHCLRGLYDTYHFFDLPFDPPNTLPPRLLDLRRHMREPLRNPRELKAFFDLVFALRGDVESEVHLQFPGPLTREVVHYLDAYALRKDAIIRHAAISRTVATRSDYFPRDVSVQVAYPPSGLEGLRQGEYDYFFTASRLDAPKRIDLIVRAFRMVDDDDVRLKIAGTGPEEARLRELAEGDSRIDFLGYVDNQQLAELYAGARAVVFVPYDEDLGYITIEAMRSSKPVVTTSDAGGPLEFVRHGENGLIADPNPKSLAHCIQQLSGNRDRCIALGTQGRHDVARISWAKAVDVLLAEDGQQPAADPLPRRKKIVVLSTFPVYPPVGGGQCRIFHLWRQIAKSNDVIVVSSIPADQVGSEEWIEGNMREIRVPRTVAQRDYETELSRGLNWMPVTDIAFALSPELSSTYRAACEDALVGADICVISHPYSFPLVEGMHLPELWYEAHNHEASMKAKILPNTLEGRRVASRVQEIERLACSAAQSIICVSVSDRELMERDYAVDEARILMVPNGVDLDSVTYYSPAQRAALRRRLGLGDRPMAVILASWHGPNLEALEEVLAIALQFGGVEFVVVGSACNAVSARDLPQNVHLVGVVSDEEKDVLLAAASVALNPMQSGGGSNLKLLDYMASGAPVVTSKFGARGSEIDETMAWIYDSREDLSETFSKAISASASQVDSKTTKARWHVERLFSWKITARTIESAIGKMGKGAREVHV